MKRIRKNKDDSWKLYSLFCKTILFDLERSERFNFQCNVLKFISKKSNQLHQESFSLYLVCFGILTQTGFNITEPDRYL